MKYSLSIVTASVVGIVVTTTAWFGHDSVSAQQARTPRKTYIGLWQGVDEVDGGNSLRSILPTQSGFRVVGRDTWHGSCGYGDPATVLAQLSVRQEFLEGTWNLDCQAGDTAQTGDRSFKVRYTFDPATQTLTETLLNPQTGEPINRIPIVFFRIAP
ncbi:hypothetical protein [Microcoleus sp.]|uniref:hypothetical protein n=1 Tax=Microcoleus sp. TaxID=44472 RepID=UPI0035261E9F